MTDQFSICRHCGSDACYENNTGASMIWQCMDCGFYTSTQMLKNSEVVKYIKDTSPSLINDLSFKDDSGFIWYPRIFNKPGIGILFPDGTGKDDWAWCFAPEVPIPEEDRFKYPMKDKPGQFHTHRINYNLKSYYNQYDYIVAMEENGLLNPR